MATPEESYAAIADSLPVSDPDLPRPVFDTNDFFKQRKKHRAILFYFSIGITAASFLLLAYIVIFHLPISDVALSTLAVSVFGEAFGVIYIIAKSVWSNHEFGLLKNRK